MVGKVAGLRLTAVICGMRAGQPLWWSSARRDAPPPIYLPASFRNHPLSPAYARHAQPPPRHPERAHAVRLPRPPRC